MGPDTKEQPPTSLADICETGDEASVSQFLSQNHPTEDELRTALRIASRHGFAPIAAALLAHGASPDRDATLDALCSPHALPLLRAFRAAGWDVNDRLGHALDALHAAVLRDDAALAQWLLAHHADPNANNGLPAPSTLAAAAAAASPAVVALLLDHGAVLRRSGALQAAARSGRVGVMACLVGRGADVDEVVVDEWAYARPEDGRRQGTALHQAAVRGEGRAVAWLLEHGADAGIEDENGWTALRAAREAGQKDVVCLMHAHGVAA